MCKTGAAILSKSPAFKILLKAASVYVFCSLSVCFAVSDPLPPLYITTLP